MLSDVREKVLLEHRALRAELVRVSVAATRLCAQEPGARGALGEALGDLRILLAAHLASEEELLVPLFRDVEGPRLRSALAQRIVDEHAVEQFLVDRLVDDVARVGSSSDDAVVWSARRLIVAISCDMVDEERHLADLAATVPRPVPPPAPSSRSDLAMAHATG